MSKRRCMGLTLLAVTGAALVFAVAVVPTVFSVRAKEAGDYPPKVAKLAAAAEKLRPLHTRLGKPEPGEWLSQHFERGQSFDEYYRGRPIVPRGKRRVIYVQPLGDFGKTQRKIIDSTADFLQIYFNRQVKIKKDLALSIIPASARRTHPEWGMKQILTTHVLDKVLKSRLPDDAAAYIAFTTSDLWPGEGWNFVFGQASLRERVGVWSIYRNGDPDKDKDSYRLCLRRTLQTASHELGHMFSMMHCIAYECNMCGSNHRAESDSRPLACCPECAAKIWWATDAEPVKRYRQLAEFCKKHGLAAEGAFYEKSAKTLDK